MRHCSSFWHIVMKCREDNVTILEQFESSMDIQFKNFHFYSTIADSQNS